MTERTPPCARCKKHTELREAAKQAGNYRAAADHELLRRQHPSHEMPSVTARWGLPA
ncbi:hypothetical protein [Streptomyces sp. RTd22]|uniref:hypothetical protein n=1 Tax=Streptomyces sp. RTd22 TaxID=1841249 RepID=UPI000A44A25C|nr:hypothetical protein [Streptomyces sp. RTd22]